MRAGLKLNSAKHKTPVAPKIIRDTHHIPNLAVVHLRLHQGKNSLRLLAARHNLNFVTARFGDIQYFEKFPVFPELPAPAVFTQAPGPCGLHFFGLNRKPPGRRNQKFPALADDDLVNHKSLLSCGIHKRRREIAHARFDLDSGKNVTCKRPVAARHGHRTGHLTVVDFHLHQRRRAVFHAHCNHLDFVHAGLGKFYVLEYGPVRPQPDRSVFFIVPSGFRALHLLGFYLDPNRRLRDLPDFAQDDLVNVKVPVLARIVHKGRRKFMRAGFKLNRSKKICPILPIIKINNRRIPDQPVVHLRLQPRLARTRGPNLQLVNPGLLKITCLKNFSIRPEISAVFKRHSTVRCNLHLLRFERLRVRIVSAEKHRFIPPLVH